MPDAPSAQTAQTFLTDSQYEQERRANDRRLKMAEIMRQQSFQPDEKFSYAGIEAKPSLAAALAKGLDKAVSGYMQGKAMARDASIEGQRTLSAATRAKDMRAIAEALKGTPAMPETPGATMATPADMADAAQVTNGRYDPEASVAPQRLAEALSMDKNGMMPTPGGMGDQGYTGAPAKAAVPGNIDAANSLMISSQVPELQQAGLSGMAARQQAQEARALKLTDDATAAQRAKDLRMSPSYQAPVAGRDIPLPADVQAQQIEQARARATAVAQPPTGYTPNQQGGLTATPGGPADPAVIAAQEDARKKAARDQAAAKPVPAPIMKMERDDRESINTTETINGTLAKYQGLIQEGKLDLGPMANVISQGRNYVGASDDNSRNFASFRSDLEKLRNDSLRLNNGVQTDGDAQRAWNELMSNINDPKVVSQRLGEIQGYNQRAAALKSQNLEQLYDQYPGLKPKTERPDMGAPNARVPGQPSLADIQAELARRGLNQ